MNIKNQSSRRMGIILLGVTSLTITACASGGAAYRPIVDGPMDGVYMADLSDCRSVAESREYMNSDTRTGAVIGAGFGGLIGLAEADDANVEVFIGGAIVGAILGGGEAALDTREQRKSIVVNCMAGRGHRVVG